MTCNKGKLIPIKQASMTLEQKIAEMKWYVDRYIAMQIAKGLKK